MVVEVKCKKCRGVLLEAVECDALLINAHGLSYNKSYSHNCPTIEENSLLFLKEDPLPDWIQSSIITDRWSKGKFNCKHCSARIGAFDFISGIKCDCDEELILPAVYIIKSKVDIR